MTPSTDTDYTDIDAFWQSAPVRDTAMDMDAPFGITDFALGAEL